MTQRKRKINDDDGLIDLTCDAEFADLLLRRSALKSRPPNTGKSSGGEAARGNDRIGEARP
jgi:hypothetical protein